MVDLAVTSIVDYGGLAVLAGAFMFMLKWMLGNFQTQMKQMVASTRANTVTVLTMQKQLLAHDLTVRGLNPSTGDSAEERDRIAYPVYKDLRDSLSKAINTIIEKE